MLLGPSILKFSEAAFAIAVSALLAAVMSVDGFGRFSFIFAINRVATLPVMRGTESVLIKEGARLHADKDQAGVNATISWSYRYAALWFFPAVMVTWLAQRFSGAGGESALIGIAVCSLGFCALGPLMGYARAMKQASLSLIPNGLLIPVLQIAVLGACLALAWRLAVSDVLVLRGLATLIAVAVAWLVLRRLRVARPAEGSAEGQAGKADFWRLSRLAIPFAIIGSANILNRQVGLMLSGFLLSAEDVAIYRIGEQFASLLGFGAQVVNSVAMPYIAQEAQAQDQTRVRTWLRWGAPGTVLITVVPLIALAIFGPLVLDAFYPPAFAGAYRPMMILSIGYLFLSGAVFATVYLNMCGLQGRLLALLLGSTVLQLVLSFSLASLFGLEGVAWGATIAISLCSLAIWSQARRTAARPRSDGPA